MTVGSYTKARKAMQPQEPERDPRLCTAYGCPMRGSVDLTGSGKYACHAHAFMADTEKWPAMTTQLRDLQWLADFAADVQKLFNAGKPWVPFAVEFWAGDTHMLPSKWEQIHGREYGYRLLGELWHRVGVRERRPQPAGVPGYPANRGNLPLGGIA